MNYVFFFPDELRAKSLSCYGNDRIKTPNYDRLANEGVLFEQCHVQNTVCSPSRCSLFTGQYVHVNGHRTLWNLLKPHEKNLFSYLKQADYEVHIYGKNDLFSQESIPLCTDKFVGHDGLCKERPVSIKELNEDGYYDFLYNPTKGDYTEHHDYQDIKAAMKFIKARKKDDRPFILFLPIVMPHCPYTIQEPYYSMYDAEDAEPLLGKGVAKPKFHELIREHRRLYKSDFKKINAVYMGMISFTDQLLGELMDCVECSNVSDDTMIIASSDHGDYAGDYELVEKWPSGCEDVLTRVPLIIKSPGCKAGHRSTEQVELFDIFPTIMESAGLQINHTHFAHSLVPQLSGKAGDAQRAVFCEGGYNLNEPHCNESHPGHGFAATPDHIYYPKMLQQELHPQSVSRATMIRTLTHKLVIRSDGDNELYDLVSDPDEIINLYYDKSYIDVAQRLKERMLDWYVATSDVVPFEPDPRGIIVI